MTKFKKVGVAGSGTMGSGIAIVAARAGFETVVFDTNEKSLQNLKAQSADFFKKSVARGKMSEEALQPTLDRLITSTSMESLADCDIIIEAIFEDLQVKHDLFSKLNKICGPKTLFASNTSTISITEIAGGSGRDDRFVGMHFCLPAQLMKLVEMSPGINTSTESFDLEIGRAHV